MLIFKQRCGCMVAIDSEIRGIASFFKHTARKIPFMYSFSGNYAASIPVSTLMCLWAFYILPGLVHIFPPAEKADPSWEYTIRSLTHECGNWDWGPDIPFLGINVSNFRDWFFSVHGNAILQTICAKKGSGCWRWPGSNSFSMHHLSLGKFSVSQPNYKEVHKQFSTRQKNYAVNKKYTTYQVAAWKGVT